MKSIFVDDVAVLNHPKEINNNREGRKIFEANEMSRRKKDKIEWNDKTIFAIRTCKEGRKERRVKKSTPENLPKRKKEKKETLSGFGLKEINICVYYSLECFNSQQPIYCACKNS